MTEYQQLRRVSRDDVAHVGNTICLTFLAALMSNHRSIDLFALAVTTVFAANLECVLTPHPTSLSPLFASLSAALLADHATKVRSKSTNRLVLRSKGCEGCQ